jgi:GTP-binding protein
LGAPFAEFVISAVSPAQFPADQLPEIALVGRSNVGKSSMINSLLRMPKLARTSSTPGRTQTLNFYRVWPEGRPHPGEDAARARGAFYFVDMPGYGFARVSGSQKEAWRQLIEEYLLTRPNLKAVIQLVDLRHPPTRDDMAMWEWLRYHGKVRLCLATKADKLSRNEQVRNLRQAAQNLNIRNENLAGPNGTDDEAILAYSAEVGLGRDALWSWVQAVIKR